MDIKLKLELTLQQMALIRVAANIWLSRPMIAKSSDFVRFDYMKLRSTFDDKIKPKLRESLIDIFEQVDSMKLPDAIKNNLLQIMKPVGENLLDYFRRASEKWNNPFIGEHFPTIEEFCKYIEFDCFGKVDEVKTFLNIYNANDENFSLPFLFYEACTYCLEDIIHSIWNKCSEAIKFEIKLTLSTAERMLFHVEYWMQFVDKNQSWFTTEATEIDALEYCVERANTVGVKYFINKLSQDNKNMVIVPLAQRLLKQAIGGYMFARFSSRNLKQHICNLFSLLAHMTENDKKKFFILNKRRIIFFLIKEWPWKYLLLDLDYFNKDIYSWLIKTIVDDYDFYKKTVYTDLWMISEIWKKNPYRFKESIAEICWSIDKSIMLKLQAVILVTSVIDDTDGINKLRPEICQGFEMHCNTFIGGQKYEVVDLYLKNILQNDEESKLFVVLSHSKNICGGLLLSKYFDDVDRFLNWHFNNDHVQITQFKKNFTADIVFITLLCHVLKLHETDFEMLIGKLFLILEFDPSYQEKLKQRLIKNYYFKAHIHRYIKDDPKHFNHILSYFQFSSEEIVEIKKSFE